MLERTVASDRAGGGSISVSRMRCWRGFMEFDLKGGANEQLEPETMSSRTVLGLLPMIILL